MKIIYNLGRSYEQLAQHLIYIFLNFAMVVLFFELLIGKTPNTYLNIVYSLVLTFALLWYLCWHYYRIKRNWKRRQLDGDSRV